MCIDQTSPANDLQCSFYDSLGQKVCSLLCPASLCVCTFSQYKWRHKHCHQGERNTANRAPNTADEAEIDGKGDSEERRQERDEGRGTEGEMM